MPVHFSNTKFKPKHPINLASEKEYRISAYIGLRRTFNESLGRYEAYSEAEEQILEEAFAYMQSIGLQLSLQIQDVGEDPQNVREWPTVGRIQPLWVNKPKPSQFAPQAPYAEHDAPNSTTLQENEEDVW